MQIFINFGNFYKFFIHTFIKINADLIFLLKENEKEKFKFKFVIILKTTKFMKLIKKIFMNTLILRYYKFNDKSMLIINVFDFVITRIFSQLAKIDD